MRRKYFEWLTNLRSRKGRIKNGRHDLFSLVCLLHLNSLFRPCYILLRSLVILATDDQAWLSLPNIDQGRSPSPMEDLSAKKESRSKDPSLEKMRQTKKLTFQYLSVSQGFFLEKKVVLVRWTTCFKLFLQIHIAQLVQWNYLIDDMPVPLKQSCIDRW